MKEKKKNKPKIGILTFHETNNYGSWLQTYALFRFLKGEKYKVEIIDYKCKNIIERELITRQNLKKIYNKYFIKSNFFKILMKQIGLKIYSNLFFKLSKKKYNCDNIKLSNDKYDIFLIGSDLVWNNKIIGNDFTYLLDFAKKGKGKISYAASIGCSEIPDFWEKTLLDTLLNFNNISVREISLQKKLEKLLNRKIEVVSDPTMLLTKKEWYKFIKKRKIKDQYILIYFIDEKKELLKIAKKYARKKGYKIFIVAEGESNKEVNYIIPPSIHEFLTLIYYAEKIFTASYHGILFSLYFEKQFSYCNREPNERMYTLAEKFYIMKAEIHHSNYCSESEIKYTEINKKIKKYRKESQKILKNMIEECI